MTPGTESWNRGQKKQGNRPLRRLLILCEDTKSSRDYLSQFPFDQAQVAIECVGTGMNTDSLMEEAIRRKKKAESGHAPFEAIWVVFDKDDFDQGQFNRAFDLARAHPTIRACWSNECFELWYLLHFQFQNTAIKRWDILNALKPHLGGDYQKNDSSIFKTLKPNLETAITFATKLAFYDHGHRSNPSTRVHELIKELRRFDPAQQKP